MLTIISYLLLAYSGWVFSQWTWNRCIALAGKLANEKPLMDILFALAVVAFVVAIRNLFF